MRGKDGRWLHTVPCGMRAKWPSERRIPVYLFDPKTRFWEINFFPPINFGSSTKTFWNFDFLGKKLKTSQFVFFYFILSSFFFFEYYFWNQIQIISIHFIYHHIIYISFIFLIVKIVKKSSKILKGLKVSVSIINLYNYFKEMTHKLWLIVVIPV